MTDYENLSELDNYFFSLINDINDENYTFIIELMSSKYPDKYDEEFLSKLMKAFNSLFGGEVNGMKIFRELKILLKNALYNRLSKKHKNELLQKGLPEHRIITLFEQLKPYLGKITDNQFNLSSQSTMLVDFEMTTEMPLQYTNCNIVSEENNYRPKDDIKQQLFRFNMNITNQENQINTLNFSMDKKQLISFYAEIEKIQECLDKLY